MEYSFLLCLLLGVVSTDGLSVSGGWDRGSESRFRLELSVRFEYTNYSKMTLLARIILFIFFFKEYMGFSTN